VPPFFVVDSALITGCTKHLDCRSWISDCLAKLDFESSDVIVRSSGTSETIEQRGRLVSEICSRQEILSTVQSLSEKLSTQGFGNVHWVIQQHVQPVRKGHLSNVRRLSREPRDFVAEFELQGDRPGYTIPVAVRHWRDGEDITDFDLLRLA
jgi:hypothetical protein